MLGWPSHSRGQIKRSLCGEEEGEFVQSDSAARLVVNNAIHVPTFSSKNQD